MNANFKPLGLAAAVATVAAGYAGVTNASHVQLAAESVLGDLALVPYYTVQQGYATGLSIINTADRTQVIKIRLRRAADSMDAMDFNVVLSPEDVYTGTIALQGDDIVFRSNDNSCTAPAYVNGVHTMPAIHRVGAEEGYVEIISMGSPVAETYPIAIAAKHGSDGVPANCDAVRDNFFPDGSSSARGVENSISTWQNWTDAAGNAILANNRYDESDDSLKVSYFIKSDETGVEFGNNAVHFAGHMNGASMTNQRRGVFDRDFQGYDHPDLNGGAPTSALNPALVAEGAAERGRYEDIRDEIGASALINDWSQNQNGPFSVDTDWVVTFPGQYLMTDLFNYIGSLFDEDLDCNIGDPNDVNHADPDEKTCDFRDIPMTATFTVYDREERGIVVEEGDLVVSPQPPTPETKDVLDKEVNVIQWGNSPVLNAANFITVPKPEGANFGWAHLAMEQDDTTGKEQAICDLEVTGVDADGPIIELVCNSTDSAAPVIGFVAWQRNFDDLPAANYGRIVEHSRENDSPR